MKSEKLLKMDRSFRLCFVAIAFGFVLIMNGKLSIATTPHEADPPQTSNVADSPQAAPSVATDWFQVPDEIKVPPFVPEFPVCSLIVLDM